MRIHVMMFSELPAAAMYLRIESLYSYASETESGSFFIIVILISDNNWVLIQG
jgi:hypothetical protein